MLELHTEAFHYNKRILPFWSLSDSDPEDWKITEDSLILVKGLDV